MKAGRVATREKSSAHFRERLEGLLSFATEARITALIREPNPFAMRSSAETVTVLLDSGERMRFFVKQAAPDAKTNPDKLLTDREAQIYAKLLRHGRDSSPRFFGVIADRTGNPQLVLEHVDGWNLKYHHLDQWYRAAARLADLHVDFANRSDLSTHAFLLRIDDAYVRMWMQRAIDEVRIRSADLAGSLRRLSAGYEAVAALLAEQPPTLVHNDLAPKNVLVDIVADPSRVCIVDWELAGAGCGFLDIVHLKHGLEIAADAEMLRVYKERAEPAGLLPPDERAFMRLLSACEAHNTVYRLAFSTQWGIPLETVACWISEVASWSAVVAERPPR